MRKSAIVLCSTVITTTVGFFVYCYLHFPFWNYRNTSNCEVLKHVSLSQMEGYRGKQILVHRDFYPSMIKLNEIAERLNIHLILNQGYRYLGHKVKGAIVDPATFSNHQAGFAIDCNLEYEGEIYTSQDLSRKNVSRVPSAILQFIELAKTEVDLRWGGDFTPEDPVHFDLPINLENRAEWKEAQARCKNDFQHCPMIWQFWK